MGKRRFVVIVCLILLVAGVIIYRQNSQLKYERNDTGVLSSRVLSAVFTATSELKVATLSGVVFARAKGCSLRCWVPNGQETRSPYSVDYFVRLQGLPASAFRWDASGRVMSVDLPEIIIGKPNIDISRAQTKQSGAWISRDSGIAMQKQAARYLTTGAAEKAKTAEYLAQAREAARSEIERFLTSPLAAAGLPNVKVAVRFPGEAKPAGLPSEQWDRSRSIAEVLQAVR